jgi:hypothetical protein
MKKTIDEMLKGRENNMENYNKAVNEIIEDITDRCGLGDEWNYIDAYTKEEIKEDWINILKKYLKTN